MKRYLFILGFCLLPCLVYGEVYQWVDEKGIVHFGNVPPLQQGKYKVGEIKYDSNPASLKKDPQETKSSVEKLPANESMTPTVKKDTLKPDSTNQPDSKKRYSKFHDRKELRTIIKRLREKVKVPRVQKAELITAEKQAKPVADKIIQAPKEKLIEKTDAMATGPKESASEVENKKAIDVKKVATEKDADKCGVFSGFVISYEAKVAEECPGAHCAVYKRSLKKYRLKQKRYC